MGQREKTHIRQKRADVGRRLGILVLVCAVACVSAQQRPVAVAADAYQGLPVGKVEFRGLQADAQVTEQLRQLVAQNLGGVLDRQKLGRAMRALYATGRFADLRVEAQRSPQNEVSLVFVATENLFIGATSVEGAPKRPSAAQLRDTSKLELGTRYRPAAVEQGLQRMKDMLVGNGYYQADRTSDTWGFSLRVRG